jgi:hypothetical protein
MVTLTPAQQPHRYAVTDAGRPAARLPPLVDAGRPADDLCYG